MSSISLVGTTSSSVVSYDATLTLDQNDSRVKPGMSASAAVITGQASGVNVPNAAVTGSGSLGTVNLLKNGKTVSQQVVVGLRGDSRTQIISGVSAGDQLVITVALPSLSSSSTTGSGTGALGGRRARWRRRVRWCRRPWWRRRVPPARDRRWLMRRRRRSDERPAVARGQRFLQGRREGACAPRPRPRRRRAPEASHGPGRALAAPACR